MHYSSMILSRTKYIHSCIWRNMEKWSVA